MKTIIVILMMLIAGNAVYAIQAILHNNVPLLWLSILLAVINIYGIYNWPKVVK